MDKKKFILLCGPTGVGKSRVPENVATLDRDSFEKIEKDEYVTESEFYRKIISQIIEVLGEDTITGIINGTDKTKKKELTDLFNSIYFNASNNHLIPCRKESGDLTCAQLHDKELGEHINSNNKHIVLEINGDKDYSWLFYNTEEPIVNQYFNKTHSEKLLKDYDIEIYYLSGEFEQLLKDNKDRFISSLNPCKQNKCETRLGNFLMDKIYLNTIINIFKTIDKLKDTLFRNENITVYYFKRVGKTYIPLNNKIQYYMSFKINSNLYKEELKDFVINGGKKSKKRKTKKGKLKKRKYKKKTKIKTKRR